MSDESARYPFDRVSADARRALDCARQEAEDSYADFVGTEHLLLGLFRVGRGSAYRALKALAVDEIKLRAEVNRIHLDGARASDTQSMEAAKQALMQAFLHSKERAGGMQVRTGDLLVGLAETPDGIAARLLKELWCETAAILAAAERELTAGDDDD